MLLREMLERVRVEVRAANMGVKLRLMSVVEGEGSGGERKSYEPWGRRSSQGNGGWDEVTGFWGSRGMSKRWETRCEGGSHYLYRQRRARHGTSMISVSAPACLDDSRSVGRIGASKERAEWSPRLLQDAKLA
jgi:hypothetical protein